MNKNIKINKKNQGRLVDTSVDIALNDPRDNQNLNYIIKLFSQAYLPYKKSPDLQKVIRNGNFELRMSASGEMLPYGAIPRILISWIITEAVQKKSRTIPLGHNMRQFIKEIGLDTNGKKYRQVREQTGYLLSTVFNMVYLDETDEYIEETRRIMPLITESKLWWNKKNYDVLFNSEITLSDYFFELCQSAIPIDKRALYYLKKSPLCLDVYFWLSHKLFYMNKQTMVTWEQLKDQFGSEYKDDKYGKKNFKTQFKKALAEIKILYPQINYDVEKAGVLLKPSKTFVKRVSKQAGNIDN